MKYQGSKIQQIGSGSLLNINWELVSHCQFDCTYCYYRPFHSDTDYITLSKLVLKKLKAIDEDFIINLIGGEPTLHPEFHELIEQLSSINNLKEIRIVTNLVQPIDFWKKIKSNKIKVTASYHPEYPNKGFIEKLNIIKDNCKTDIAFIVSNKKELLERSETFFNKIHKHLLDSKTTISLVRLHGDQGGMIQYFEYSRDIEDFISQSSKAITKLERDECITITTDKDNQVEKSYVLKNKLNHLEGWSCDINAFIIHYDGYVSYACKKVKKHILSCDFKTTSIICPFKICECDDYWSFKKTPKEEVISE